MCSLKSYDEKHGIPTEKLEHMQGLSFLPSFVTNKNYAWFISLQRTGTRGHCVGPHPGQRRAPAETAEPWSQVPAPSSPQPRTQDPNAPERRCPRQSPSGPAYSGRLQTQSQQAEASKERRGLTICGQKEYTSWPCIVGSQARLLSDPSWQGKRLISSMNFAQNLSTG